MREMPMTPFTEWHAELPSTMDRARELAIAGAPSGTIVVADYQSAGRGTQGRIWLAPPGSCLMFTLIARPSIPISGLDTLPVRVSRSIADYLRNELGVDCHVKPPNDIMVGERKICGVLCTSHIVGNRLGWVLCGVGLNTRMTQEQLPIDAATSLAVEGTSVPDHRSLLSSLLAAVSWLLSPVSDQEALSECPDTC